ncbi:YolD-like family protein [Halobacillus sp. Cin3]|uniref:YolD-like family protein n=1 Tax=Halobacillus sp. Cin3 TaxID=2928441 RepID=UPI00248DE225|nr:YolD-like family protein [Halobacillus sp. Cin3]
MDNRNRDRGTIKWTSLMLPEHVEMIKQVWKEDERIEKPILDDQQLEEIGLKLQIALKDGLPVEVRYHNGFDFTYLLAKVIKMDVSTRRIKMYDQKNKDDITIHFDDISNVVIA